MEEKGAVAKLFGFGESLVRSITGQPDPNLQARTLVAFMDGVQGPDRKVLILDLLKVKTLDGLLLDAQQFFNISHPRLFLMRNGREIKSDAELADFVDVVVVVTPDGKEMSNTTHGLLPIPKGPPPKPYIGNSMDLFPNISESSIQLRKEYGNIFKISVPPIGDLVFLADPNLVDQILQNPDLWQKIHMKNIPLRERVGDGLFTSDDDEEIWGVAHRILIPAFSTSGMQKYLHQVIDCANQLNSKFLQIAEAKQPFDVNDWCARFTLEVISRVAFGETFNSFEHKPPIFQYIEDATSDRAQSLLQRLLPNTQAKQRVNAAWININNLLAEIITKKKKELEAHKGHNERDLMTLMLTEVDPETKRSLPDSNIVSQVLTFLVAGHDSTSTAITSLLYHLSANPEIENKVIQEIEEVLNGQPLQWMHLSRLKYCQKVINENLRLLPPAGFIRKTTVKDTALGNYFLPKGSSCLLNIWAIHYNPEVWPNPDLFDPERFNEDQIAKRSPSAWMPFSYGPRACIGQQLSVLEQKVFLALVYSRFHFRLHKSANIHLTFPLFAKTNGINMVIYPRSSKVQPTLNTLSPSPLPPVEVDSGKSTSVFTTPLGKNECDLLILYGSNMETCKRFSEQLDQKGRSYGFGVTVLSLDAFLASGFQKIPKNGAVFIIASTYNGEPPDNAKKFNAFLKSGEASKVFSGVRYAVFGAGNSQWRRTFLQFPIKIDQVLENSGALKIGDIGRGDCDRSIDDDFDQWQAKMWVELQSALSLTITKEEPLKKSIQVQVVDTKYDRDALSQLRTTFGKLNNAFRTNIVQNRELQSVDSERSTKHIELNLAPEQTYETGDHLAVFPLNPVEVVERTAKALNLGLDTVVVIQTMDKELNYLPINTPASVELILKFCVELQLPATRNQISYLATKTECPPEKQALESLSVPSNTSPKSYQEYVLKQRRTLVELLEEFKSVKIDFGEFLSLVVPLRPRYYSISSSSTVSPKQASITVSVVKGPTPTGRTHIGVASNFLALLPPDGQVLMLIKHSTFKLPTDPTKPIIMVGPGTGMAPMRGFLQERRVTKATGQNLLFFGCRNESEFIYKEELEGYVKEGSLVLHVAYSRMKNYKVYVQDLIEEQSELVYGLLNKGAYVYVCGDAKEMAPAVKNAFAKAIQKHAQKTPQLALEEIHSMLHTGRYCEDVWAG